MRTAQLKLGPLDHGRRLTLDEFDAAEWKPGSRYEIIDGRLYVSAEPDPPENVIENWLLRKLFVYQGATPGVLNYVTNKARVFVHARRSATVPEPDMAAYTDFPLTLPLLEMHWEDISPVLVCEVLRSDIVKDLDRNVDLYLAVPSIREYWVIDAWDDPEEPTLVQHRRHGKRWVVRRFGYGTTFTTKLLPGFSLLIDPRK
jgi:Uma2 family endonuclease